MFKIFRGEKGEGGMKEYSVEVTTGMVVLDAVHQIQAGQAPDMAVRWNCKAAKCGSCSAEVNGRPKLMCKSRLDDLPADRPVEVRPIRTFAHIKDLVADVSWNYEVNKKIPPFTPIPDRPWRWKQEDVERVQEFRKCIECFLCQDVCHVLRDHQKQGEFFGPRFFVRLASLEMHPMDALNRVDLIKSASGVGFCNITKCCTEVCPEDIRITDNAIIPIKERVVDRYFDPIRILFQKLFGKFLSDRG